VPGENLPEGLPDEQAGLEVDGERRIAVAAEVLFEEDQHLVGGVDVEVGAGEHLLGTDGAHERVGFGGVVGEIHGVFPGGRTRREHSRGGRFSAV
jgi:hypothetical protein